VTYHEDAGRHHSTDQLHEVERTITDDTGEHKFEVHKPLPDDLTTCVGNADLKFLIATVPDPIGSHLGLEFDRAIESLQRGAAARGFSFERYWLPWRPAEPVSVATTSEATARLDEERLRQEQPGLLIFRRDSEDATTRLLVLLVGETPTAGLNKPAFFKSLRYIDQLTPQPSEIDIVGPAFSSTLLPLSDSIHEYSSGLSQAAAFHVVNYGARTKVLIDTFRERLQASSPKSTLSSLDLTFTAAEEKWFKYFCQMGYDSDQMAILAEDRSTYGNAVFNRDNAANNEKTPNAQDKDQRCDTEFDHFVTTGLSLSFPRDLSSMRNATENEDSTPAPQQVGGVNIPYFGVTLNLRQDETSEHEMPQDFAQNQSSARVDRALRMMVKMLRTRRVQAVLITATNPLDRIFLLEYLHTMAPDVRLATIGADDFVLARPRHIDLSGVLAITSLPLTENSATVGGRRLSVTFPSNASEGIFIATAMLLGEGRPDAEPKRNTMLWPASDAAADNCSVISIVGKTGFRPADDNNRQYPCLVNNRSGVFVGRAAGSNQPKPLPFIWVIALIGLLVFSTAHLGLVCSSNEWLGIRFLPRLRCLTVSSCSLRDEQLFFLFVATGQILLLEWMAVTTTYRFIGPSIPSMLQLLQKTDIRTLLHLVLYGLHCYLLMCCVLMCGTLGFRLAVDSQRKHSRAIIVVLVFTLLFMVATAWSWHLILKGSGSVHDLTSAVTLRTVYFSEGLSPLLPIFFVLIAYYLWSVNNLRRLSMIVTRVTLWTPTNNDWSREIAHRIGDVQVSIRRTIDLRPSCLAMFALTILGVFLMKLPSALHGVETGPLRIWLLTCGFTLLLLITVSTFYRSWNLWLQLKKVLRLLDTAMLGKAFSHVPKELSSMKIWSLGGTRISLMVQMRTAKLLQKLDKKPAVRARAVAATADGLGIDCDGDSIGPERTGTISPFSVLHEMAGLLHSGEVIGRPLARQLSACLNSRMAKAEFLFDPEAASVSTLPIAQRIDLEFYLALRFVAFFRYVMLQLRNQLTFVIYGFACLVVGMAVYPFQGRESLGTLTTFGFILLLGGVAVMMVQIYHDPILKRLEGTSGGVSGTFEIAMKVIGVAGVPLCAVLASQFPSIADVILNWVRPVLEVSH
jgi:hypothetical protein